MAAPSTLVYYSIPSDHDDMEHPNVFVIKKAAEELKIRDVRDKFPLPGVYHFRFKVKVENDSKPLWLDRGLDDAVPLYNKKVVMKVLRVTWNSAAVPTGASVQQQRPVQQQQPAARPAQQQPQQPASANLLDFGAPSAPTPVATPKPPMSGGSMDLLNF